MSDNNYDNLEMEEAAFDIENQKLKQLSFGHSRERSTSFISRRSSSFISRRSSSSISRSSSGSISGPSSPIHEQNLQHEDFSSPNTVNEPDWEILLPFDYEDIICRSVNPVAYATKKDLYLSLCESPILLDEGNTSFHLDKETGKKCYMIGAKELRISSSENPKYWEWKSHVESRFPMVATLLHLWWLDIRGKIEAKMLSPKTHYAAFLVFRLTHDFDGLGSAKGMIKFLIREDDDDAEKRATTLQLQPPEDANSTQNAVVRRPDGWMEVVLANFYIDKGGDGTVEARLLEIQTDYKKTGLIIEGIEFRPPNAKSVMFSKKDVKKVEKGFLAKYLPINLM